MKISHFLFIPLILLTSSLFSQGFLMNKFFKPGVKFNTEYQANRLTNDNYLDFATNRLGMSIPIKSKLGVKIDWKQFKLTDLKALGNWKETTGMLQKYIQPKVHQIIWNGNLNYYNLYGNNFLQADSTITPFSDGLNLVGVNTGITGFHYLRKARILFYSTSIGLVENISHIKGTRPYGSVLAGVAQVAGLSSVVYFGGYLGFGNGVILPAPFLGFDVKLAKKLRLNVTLPVQIKLTYSKKKNHLSFLVAMTGFLSGYEKDNNIHLEGPLTTSYLKLGVNYSFKVSKKVRLFLDAGWADLRRFNFGSKRLDNQRPSKVTGAPYIGISFDRKLGKSLFDASIGNMLN